MTARRPAVRWPQPAADRPRDVYQVVNFLLAGFELVGGPTSYPHAWWSGPAGRGRSLRRGTSSAREASTMSPEICVTYEAMTGVDTQ